MGGIVPWSHPFFSSDFPNSSWDLPTATQMFSRTYDMSILREEPDRGLVVPYWMRNPQKSSSVAEVVNDPSEFRITLNVSQFLPEEIEVKTVRRHLVIEGTQKEKSAQNLLVCRRFVRKYVIPADGNLRSVLSTISHTGVLTVTVKKIRR